MIIRFNNFKLKIKIIHTHIIISIYTYESGLLAELDTYHDGEVRWDQEDNKIFIPNNCGYIIELELVSV